MALETCVRLALHGPSRDSIRPYHASEESNRLVHWCTPAKSDLHHPRLRSQQQVVPSRTGPDIRPVTPLAFVSETSLQLLLSDVG